MRLAGFLIVAGVIAASAGPARAMVIGYPAGLIVTTKEFRCSSAPTTEPTTVSLREGEERVEVTRLSVGEVDVLPPAAAKIAAALDGMSRVELVALSCYPDADYLTISGPVLPPGQKLVARSVVLKLMRHSVAGVEVHDRPTP